MAEKQEEATQTDELPEIDLKTLIVDEEPAKEPVAEKEVEAEKAESEPKEPKPDEAETLKAEGTPDKALQKVQQDMATAMRTMNELKEKLDTGKDLTAKEQAKLEKAESSIDRIRKAMAGDDFDVLDNAKPMAEALLEAHEKNASLESRLNRIEKRDAEEQTNRFFAEAGRKFPGVDAEAVWKKAAEDTMALLELTPDEMNDERLRSKAVNATTKMFNERCSNAAKAIVAKGGIAPKTGKPAPTITPGGAKIQTGTTGVMQAAMADEDAQALQTYRQLWKDE